MADSFRMLHREYYPLANESAPVLLDANKILPQVGYHSTYPPLVGYHYRTMNIICFQVDRVRSTDACRIRITIYKKVAMYPI